MGSGQCAGKNSVRMRAVEPGAITLRRLMTPSASSCPPPTTRLLSGPAAARCGPGGVGVLGPGMLRVASPKVFSHLEIGRGPEAAKVVGDLHGPVVRAEEMQQDGDPARGDPGSV